MKIAIFTMGTRGDIQPYIYLARELKKNGHSPVVASHPCWKSLVENSGISFASIGPNIDIEQETSKIRGENPNMVFSMLKTMNFVFKIIESSTSEIYETSKGKDLIIVSHSQMGAAEAEALGIPTINVTLQTEMVPQNLKKKTFGDRIFNLFVGPKIVKPYNKIRKIYNLPKLKNSSDLISGKINLIPISKIVKKRNPFWDEKNQMTGYWYEEDLDFSPSVELKDFLEKGDRPIILALGAMAFEAGSEKDKLDLFINAFNKTGKRAIIQGFQKTLADYNLPENMISVGSIPHSWLFRQGYAVIHHCGFGTSSAAMIYGIPSIPVPHILDQFGFAKNLYEIGVSVKPIPSNKLNEKSIIDAIQNLDKNYESLSKKVVELSKQLQMEKGLEKSVFLIEKSIKY